jgi:hypothetical protein
LVKMKITGFSFNLVQGVSEKKNMNILTNHIKLS